MRKIGYLLFLAVVTGFLVGCAYTPHKVALRPAVVVAEANVGGDVEVAVKVVDERPEQSLGHRGTAFGKAAEITTDQDVAGIFHEQVVEGLKKKGFSPVVYAEDFPRRLKVEVRLISYSTSTGLWTGGVHTKAAIKAVASNNEKTYEKLYRAENEVRKAFVPSAKTNIRLINEIVSQVLQKLFQDQDLMAFLAK
jgi:uncharacterized lipoprotein